MSTIDVAFRFVRTEAGGYRAIPIGISHPETGREGPESPHACVHFEPLTVPIEATSLDGLMSALRESLDDIFGGRAATNDPEEDAALAEIEKTALRGPALERLAKTFPPHPSWFDEPEI